MNNQLIKQIKNKMEERKYGLVFTSGNDTILSFNSNLETGYPILNVEVYIQKDETVDFKFMYFTKRYAKLCTDKIGSFFDDEHFNKFETDFWNLATELYNYENK